MSRQALRVLMLSKDPSLFDTSPGPHIGDARQRHIFYAHRLRVRFPGSELRVLTYTPRAQRATDDEPCDGLHLFGTSSIHRATYAFDVLRRLPAVLAGGWYPHVVTTQTPWEEGVIGCWLSRRLGARFIPQVHFELFSKEWIAEHWLNRWRLRVARQILGAADRVRVVSNRLREKVASECDLPLDRVTVVPVGVNFIPVFGDKANFKARVSAALINRKVVLFVGRLCAAKNLGLLAKAAQRVASQISDAAFVIVGDGPDEQVFRHEVEHNGLMERFVFLGSKEHKDLPPIYAAADVFLLTSHYEGFGRVVLESLLSGIPVVSTRCSGPEDLIEDGRCGYLLPRGDAEGLANAISTLLVDEKKAAEFGAAGRMRAETLFSLESLTDRLIDTWTAT